MYCAAPCATRRMFPNVKSSAITPRQPSVPNLIVVAIFGLKVTGLARPLESFDHLAHVLGARARAHEQRVLGVDDDHVLEADRGHQPPVAKDQAAGRVDQDGFTLDRVATGV